MEKFPHENEIEKKEKPEVLYLAAKTPNISELVPMKRNYRDENEGAVIFSTPDKALASAFLVEGHGDHWMKIGFYGDIPVVVIKSDREEFIKKDKGGSMYTVSSDTFDFDPEKGMGEKEWVSKVPVKPLSETKFNSALDAMIENGVQVYFVDENTFEAINNSSNHGYGILIRLTSENEKRGQSIRNLKELNWNQESFEDARARDLSKRDFSNTSIDAIKMMDFDTETLWPEKEKLPQDFNPKEFLEESKNPGLGIRELHEQGIDGRGIVVAIIDQELDINHPEYKDQILDYSEYGGAREEGVSMHGPSVASLLVGKNCGVAPGAKLVYKAVPSTRDFHFWSEAMNDIIQKNKEVSSDKVRIVSCSIGHMHGLGKLEPGLDKWIEALKIAKEAGIFVVDVNGNQIDIPFVGGGSPENKDDFENYFPWLRQNNGDEELDKLVAGGNVDEILKKLRETKKDEISNISDFDLREKIKERIVQFKSEIIVPSDYRTMASSWRKEGQYMYNGRGGISWSVPYLAGLYALALQVNPNIEQEEIAKIIKETAIVNKRGLKIINPKGIIDLVKEKSLEEKENSFLEAILATSIQEIPTKFEKGAVQELVKNMKNSKLFLLGEMHGVKENADIIYTLFKKFGFRQLALEWRPELKEVAEHYLETGKLNTETIEGGEYGHITAGHFALLKKLKSEGLLEKFICFDGIPSDGSFNERDKIMAKNILNNISDDPTLVVSGNLHSKTESFVHDNDFNEYHPMGKNIKKEIPRVPSGKIMYLQGQYYNLGIKDMANFSHKVNVPEARFFKNKKGEYIFLLPKAHAGIVPSINKGN